MPIDLPNRELFRPYYPKSQDTHYLFGAKYHKIHQFSDKRWMPTAPITQYHYMVNVLSKNLEVKKLERNVLNLKEKKDLITLRNQCRDGRIKLHTSKQGNITKISNIFTNHRDMRRMYMGLPSQLIVEKINQRTFLKRKENDRLKFKLKTVMDTYANKLSEQSKIEDRLKYQNEFILQEDVMSSNCRKKLANSETRIKAFKLINRAYLQIRETLQKDDIYLESILNSLEDDILEQSNFIHQVILIGIPAMEKYKVLAADYSISEDIFRSKLRSNLNYINKSKKKLKDDEDSIKNIIRKNCDSIGDIRKYVRETPSMLELRSSIEEMAKTVAQIKNATYSPMVTDIIQRMEKTVIQNIKMEKHLVREDKLLFTLESKEETSEAMKTSLINNSCEAETERLQLILELEEAIRYEKTNQKAYDQYIINNGKLFDTFRLSLCNLTEILRHVGNNVPVTKQQYPNEELKLPLLGFTNEDRIRVFPPTLRNIEMEKMMETVREKISVLISEYHRVGKVKFANKIYYKAYMDSVKTDTNYFEQRKSLGEFQTEKLDVNVPTRHQIKLAAAKIVFNHKMQQEFEMADNA